MTTISKDVGRCDLLLHRSCDERVGVRWLQDRQDGRGYVPVDLSSWEATLTLLSPLGTTWGTWPCTCTDNGYAYARIGGADTSGSEWLARASGSWRIDASGPDGERELLGWGYFSMS